MIARFVKNTVRRLGYDIVPFPMPDWCLLRNTLQEVFADLRINCVIDVGANYGQYGDFLRRLGYQGRIVSFEPVGETFQRLSRRAESDSAWMTHHLALGSAAQEMEINVSNTDQFSSFLAVNSYGNNQFAKETAVARTERVQVTRLDSMIDQIVSGIDDPRVYLKLDTQGFDLQVLEGATGCLPQILGVQSEIGVKPIYRDMPDYLSSLARFNELGFSVVSLVPVSRDAHLSVIEFDCVMVRNSSAT